MLTLKLKYFVHYYKSKILKKKFKKNNKDQKIQFENDIKEKSFSNKWFLNNVYIFSFFLPQDKNSKFNYLEVGCFEGLSSFFVLSEYKAVNAILLDIWDMPNPNSKTLSHNFSSIEKAFDNNLSGFNFTKIKDDSEVAMRKLFKKNKAFDFIYRDGSNNGEDIL